MPIDPEPYLKLDPFTFDQDVEAGWRAVEQMHGAEVATRLIELYLREQENKEHSVRDTNLLEIIHFHLGQVLASRGEEYYPQSITALEKAFHEGSTDWNSYVDGTIAFLSQDKARLERAISDLRAVENRKGTGSTNLRFLEKYLESLNFGKGDYGDAYSSD